MLLSTYTLAVRLLYMLALAHGVLLVAVAVSVVASAVLATTAATRAAPPLATQHISSSNAMRIINNTYGSPTTRGDSRESSFPPVTPAKGRRRSAGRGAVTRRTLRINTRLSSSMIHDDDDDEVNGYDCSCVVGGGGGKDNTAVSTATTGSDTALGTTNVAGIRRTGTQVFASPATAAAAAVAHSSNMSSNKTDSNGDSNQPPSPEDAMLTPTCAATAAAAGSINDNTSSNITASAKAAAASGSSAVPSSARNSGGMSPFGALKWPRRKSVPWSEEGSSGSANGDDADDDDDTNGYCDNTTNANANAISGSIVTVSGRYVDVTCNRYSPAGNAIITSSSRADETRRAMPRRNSASDLWTPTGGAGRSAQELPVPLPFLPSHVKQRQQRPLPHPAPLQLQPSAAGTAPHLCSVSRQQSHNITPTPTPTVMAARATTRTVTGSSQASRLLPPQMLSCVVAFSTTSATPTATPAATGVAAGPAL